MIRLTIAAVLALCVHAGFFWIDIPWSQPILLTPQSRAVSMDLVTFQKAVEKPVPPEPNVVKPRSKLKLKPKPKPKPVSKPVVQPPPEPHPIRTEPLPEPKAAAQVIEPDIETQDAIIKPGTIVSQESSTAESHDRAGVQASIPRYDLNPPPHYPRVARRRNYQGTVILDVRVTVDGRVAQVRIAESSGYAILDQSAVKSVQNWHFTPARRGGQLIEMWVQVPVRYELR
jgi:periplasmic protein TonB